MSSLSADGIIRENIRTLEMIHFKEEERPIGIQIFGNDPDVMATATRYINKNFSPDIIDINYGCPVPKVTKKGGGSAALKDLCLMDDITQAVVQAADETPVTVKMRAGWDLNSIIIEEAGPRIENFGVKAITLHPRTTTQKYTGKANWDLIKILKQSISIPVIGNGDIKNIDDIKRMFDYTNCDGVMIARAAQGNPWIFDQAKALFKKNYSPNEITLKSISTMCEEHLNLLVKERDGVYLKLLKELNNKINYDNPSVESNYSNTTGISMQYTQNFNEFFAELGRVFKTTKKQDQSHGGSPGDLPENDPLLKEDDEN